MLTTDPNDPELGHGSDDKPVPMNKKYLVLSEEERAKGFIRPVRCEYIHKGKFVGRNKPRELTEEEKVRYSQYGYVAFVESDDKKSSIVGIFLSQKDIEQLHDGYVGGCNHETTMGLALSETYARDPNFYGSTYCVHCSMHRPVGEFVWKGTDEVVGS